jgi:hypothetical protein
MAMISNTFTITVKHHMYTKFLWGTSMFVIFNFINSMYQILCCYHMSQSDILTYGGEQSVPPARIWNWKEIKMETMVYVTPKYFLLQCNKTDF